MKLAAVHSVAMLLERHREATLFDQPLDISVQDVLDAQDEVTRLCLDAGVFDGDNKVDKSRSCVTA